jgi:uncharacterized protein (DUF927 family)
LSPKYLHTNIKSMTGTDTHPDMKGAGMRGILSSDLTFTAGEVKRYYATRVPHLKQRRLAEWRGACPIHHGKNDNFAVEPDTGRWFCHSTCGRGGDILELEIALKGDDFKSAKGEVFRIVGRPEANGNRRRIAATYDYTDEGGRLLFQTVRFDPKDFKQRQPDGKGGWKWSIKGVRLVLYRLPEVLKRSTETVFICEGEKDVHLIESLGLLATCNPMGAGKWRTEYSDMLRGRSIVILPDNDKPGRKHAMEVAAGLLQADCRVNIVELPRGKDVSDWKAEGGNIDELLALLKQSQVLTADSLKDLRKRWGVTNEEHAADGTAQPPPPTKAAGRSFFRVTVQGVTYIDPADEKEHLKICGRLEVVALTRDAKGDNWGRLLKWVDAEGRVHQWAMPMSLLAGDGNEYRSRLLDGGLTIEPGYKARKLLTNYVQGEQPEALARCVARVGWHGDVFVLPGETIEPAGAETVLYQTPVEAEHYLNVSGTVEDWKEHIGLLCSGNSRLLLAVSSSFAGPVLSLLGAESGGVNFVGLTSTGKTTALVVGGSALGGGGRNGFVQSWRVTANGLEAIAELHNDLTLFLDELAQIDPHDAAETAYLLGNGSGKVRMSRSIGARKKLSWSLLFVSAGELTLADHAQTAGKRTKGGAEIRLLNIDADGGVDLGLFENIHGAESPDAFSRQLKDAARQYYGAPLRAYLTFLTANRAMAEKAIKNFQADFLKNNVPAKASGEVFRAGQRFALIAAAGELATSIGITGWAQGDSSWAAARCFASWIDHRGTTGTGDGESAIRQVRKFIEANGQSRFQVIRDVAAAETGADLSDENQKVINRAGFRRKNANDETEYLILRETFKSEVCAGFDYKMVCHALKACGALEFQPPDLTKSVRVPGNSDKLRVFCVKASILEG